MSTLPDRPVSEKPRIPRRPTIARTRITDVVARVSTSECRVSGLRQLLPSFTPTAWAGYDNGLPTRAPRAKIMGFVRTVLQPSLDQAVDGELHEPHVGGATATIMVHQAAREDDQAGSRQSVTSKLEP